MADEQVPHEDPERLRTPMRRVGDTFEPATWAEDFAYAGSRMRELRRQHGRDAVGAYLGDPTARSSAVFAIEGLDRMLRSRNIFSAPSVHQFPQYLAAGLMCDDHTILPVVDVDRTIFLLVLGSNPASRTGRPRRCRTRGNG